jgi:hypothetical protein
MYFCRDLWLRSARDAMDEVDRANAGHMAKRADVVVEEVAARDPMMEEALQARQEDNEPPTNPKMQEVDEEAPIRKKPGGAPKIADADANAGSDYDAIPDEEGGDEVPAPEPPSGGLSIPNSVFRPARILVNPRCVTTYAGVRHAQLARDLFGDGEDIEREGFSGGKYVLEDWEGAPDSFVCQEQRYACQ